MGIYLRGDVWYASYKDASGKRKRKSLGTKDRDDADAVYYKLKLEAWRATNFGEIPRVLFDAACLRWLKEKSDKKTLSDDRSRIFFWMSHFGGKYLDEVTVSKIYTALESMTNRKHEQNWRAMSESCSLTGKAPPAYLPKNVAIATKNTHLALLRAILRKASLDWGWLAKAPHIHIYRVRNKRVRWIHPDEANRLIAACSEPLKSVVKFALATGLRKSNIFNLEWQQVDMRRCVAWVNPEDSKSNRAIGVALNDTACRVLRDQIGNHHKWVFVHTKQANRPDGTKTPKVRKMRVDDKRGWYMACKRAGIENFRFHDLRHTWASWLVQSGVPLSVLQEMGGWESIEMVKRYAHLSPEHLLGHAKKLDGIFKEK